MCSMWWQILWGARMSFSACSFTAFWQANHSFSLLLLMAKGSVAFIIHEKFWIFFLQIWEKKNVGHSPRLSLDFWSLLPEFSLLLGRLISFMLREASYTLVVWDYFLQILESLKHVSLVGEWVLERSKEQQGEVSLLSWVDSILIRVKTIK